MRLFTYKFEFTHLTGILLVFCFLASSTVSVAEESGTNSEPLFQYVRLGLVHQLPAIRPKSNFESTSDLGFSVGLEYEYLRSWLLSFDFKISNIENSDFEFEEIALFNLQQSIKYLIRVYYPLYLTVGYDLGFLYVARRMKAPPESHPDFNAKAVMGINVGSLWKYSDMLRFHVNVSRWRGLDGDKLHAIELQFGLSYQI